MQTFLLIICLFFFNTVLAGEQQGFEVVCNGKTTFSISGYDIEDNVPVEEQKPGSSVYLDYDKHHVHCVLDKNIIEADFQVSSPQPRGECGSSPGGEIGITVNGVSILRNGIRLNEGCFDTIGSVEINNYYSRHAWGCTSESPKCRDGYILKICGSYTKTDDYLHNLKYNGCVSVMDEQLKRIQPPLELSWNPLNNLLKLLVAPQQSPQQSTQQPIGSSSAPSFDCAKVSSGTEKLICSNKQLGEADIRLSSAYADYLKKVADKEAAKNQQVFWLKYVRDGCETAECLLNAYSKRIAELTKQ